MSGLTGLQLFGLLCAIAAPLSVCLIALLGRLNDTRRTDPKDEPHPPHRQCGCAACAPSFRKD